MKNIILLIVLTVASYSISEASNVEKLISKDFCVMVDNHKEAFGQTHTIRYKIGMYPNMLNDADWKLINFGIIEGRQTSSSDFTVVSLNRQKTSDNIEQIIIQLKHNLLPIQATVIFSSYGTTGVITSSVTLKNTSSIYPIRIAEIPSFELGLSPSTYEYSCLTSGWGSERKFKTAQMCNDTINFESTAGRSSINYSPWLNVHDKDRDIYYTTQLAWSGNWHMRLVKRNNELFTQMGECFDNGQLTLLPNTNFELPEVAVSGAYHSMDAVANNLHRYQRQYLIKGKKQDDPMLVQFNTWFPLQVNTTAQNLRPYIDAAADLGLESFTIDAGWFVKDAYEPEVGNWKTNLTKFPNGLGETANYIRSKGMKFGLWFEMESVGEKSEVLQQHPDWCLQYDGKPVICEPWSHRRHLDFSNPKAFAWALKQFDNMYKECHGIDWVKLDYNISIGSHFQNKEGIGMGDCMHNHITSYYRWLDTLAQKYPNLIIENCASGALRMDIGMLRHVNTSWVSDETSVNPSLGMAWSSNLDFTPRMSNHWIVGMGNGNPVIDQSLPRGYWDYMFRVPMNGQFGISSQILDWSPELRACAKENIALYKKIRTIIADADCYHLTPQPDYNDPQGWTVLAYVAENTKEAVVMANRGRGGEDTYTLRLNQLKPSARYKIEINGKEYDHLSGSQLAKDGLKIKLDNYRASVIAFYEQ